MVEHLPQQPPCHCAHNTDTTNTEPFLYTFAFSTVRNEDGASLTPRVKIRTRTLLNRVVISATINSEVHEVSQGTNIAVLEGILYPVCTESSFNQARVYRVTLLWKHWPGHICVIPARGGVDNQVPGLTGQPVRAFVSQHKIRICSALHTRRCTDVSAHPWGHTATLEPHPDLHIGAVTSHLSVTVRLLIYKQIH